MKTKTSKLIAAVPSPSPPPSSSSGSEELFGSKNRNPTCHKLQTKKKKMKHNKNPSFQKPVDQESESEDSQKSNPKKSATTKRLADKEPESSRAKKKQLVIMQDKETKKPLFQRLWSSDDELTILKGIKDYVKKRGKASDALADMNAFHSFIKASLEADGNAIQLQDKVRRLKKKFLNNVAKDGNNKKKTPLVFSKPHEQKMYDLSKMVWGLDGVLLEPGTKSVKGGDGLEKMVGKHFLPSNGNFGGGEGSCVVNKRGGLWKKFGNVGGFDEMVNEGLEFLEEGKRIEFEEKWRKLREENYKLDLKKLNLTIEQTNMILEVMEDDEKANVADVLRMV